jgi:CHAT domain-containing protein
MCTAVLKLVPEARAEMILRSVTAEYLHHNAEGEVLARENLVLLLVAQERFKEAGREVEREIAAAQTLQPPLRSKYLALTKISGALLLSIDGDYQHAGLLLDEVVPGPLRDERWVTAALWVHNNTGQIDRTWDDGVQLSQPTCSHYDRADGLYWQAWVLTQRAAELPAAANTSRIEEMDRAAIREAETGNNPRVAALAHLQLARLSKTVEQARTELHRCLEVAPENTEKAICARDLALYRVLAGKASAAELPLLEVHDQVSRALGWGLKMRVSWKTGPFDAFIRDAQRALSEIEQLRARQGDAVLQAGLLSIWSDTYYWFAGRLLEAALEGRCPSCLDRAFSVVERLRARSLLDAVAAAGTGVSAAQPDGARIAALRKAIERASLRREESALPSSQRAEAESDLKAFAAEEDRLRLAGSIGVPAAAGATKPANSSLSSTIAAESPGFASLSGVQALLAPDEAMLSFQIAPWRGLTGDFGGGSWLVVATRAARRCYRLGEMGRDDLRNGVADLFEHRSRSQSWLAAELYRRLLVPALDELPAGIKRLIVVPDDHLHRLPFAALRATPTSEPLAWRYQISIVPSATLWAHWRGAPKPPRADRPALVLADPPPPTPDAQKTFQAAGIKLPVERLPAARREADALVRFLGWGCERRVDGAVSVAAVLDAPAALRSFALVHFAAHSIVDDLHPRQSGIWLSPSPGHGGLLQTADIVKLGFDDRLVVLSTCSSNGGPFLRGEGVMSLAHAFFQARARTVVASLWPQVDTDAEALLTGFYRHLGQGASVAAALRLAQLELLRQDSRLPPVAWAGMVVLGDGDLVPFPGGRRPWRIGWLMAAAAASLLGMTALVFFAVRTRRVGRSSLPIR